MISESGVTVIAGAVMIRSTVQSSTAAPSLLRQ